MSGGSPPGARAAGGTAAAQPMARSAAEGAACRRRSLSCRAASATAAWSSRRWRRPERNGTRTDTPETAVKARNIHMPVRNAMPTPTRSGSTAASAMAARWPGAAVPRTTSGAATLEPASDVTASGAARGTPGWPEPERDSGVAAADRGRRGHRGRSHAPAIDAGAVRTAEVHDRDVRVRDVQARVLPGERGIRDHDLGAAASDPEPVPAAARQACPRRDRCPRRAATWQCAVGPARSGMPRPIPSRAQHPQPAQHLQPAQHPGPGEARQRSWRRPALPGPTAHRSRSAGRRQPPGPRPGTGRGPRRTAQ